MVTSHGGGGGAFGDLCIAIWNSIHAFFRAPAPQKGGEVGALGPVFAHDTGVVVAVRCVVPVCQFYVLWYNFIALWSLGKFGMGPLPGIF